MVVWQRPDLLVLDEPTNHLDLDMRHAMEVALQTYEGAVLLVSHDRHLLRNTVEELLLVHDGKVDEYREDLDTYEQWVLSSYRQSDKTTPMATATTTDNSRREQRVEAAAQRAALRPLMKNIQKTEKTMAEIESELAAIQERLGDGELYDGDRKNELAGLLKKQGVLKSRATELEELWFEQQHTLEEIKP
jgi:ATP-binding cassette subfamily F protein 3